MQPGALMNVSANLVAVSDPDTLGQPLIGDDVIDAILMALSVLILLFGFPSIILNMLNAYIFLNTKLDSVTVCFISLALSDMTSMSLLSINACLNCVSTTLASGTSWGKSMPVLSYLLSFIFQMFNGMSSATTTYIAVQRGLCVAFPFQTRHAFNKNRSIIICLATSVGMLVLTLPRFAFFRLITVPDPDDNNTRLIVFDYFDSWDSFNSFYLLTKTALVFVQYGTMVVCTIAISTGMKSSMKLKEKSNVHSTSEQRHNRRDMDVSKSGERNQQQERKDTKEALVVKQSLIVVLIHVIFTSPRIFGALVLEFEPRFQLGGQFQNLFLTFFYCVNVADSINAFANFFVYVNFNTKFKKFFKNELCSRKVEE